ncbi:MULTISPECIES: TMEM175 family protein [unclassified Leeuwenhoekiella]|uniref:TMEM175 family protein n=1 Tax=unclassified Leeuwenhoekiella TaxID=2615029 RepID=UPI000C4AC960|nr:MULTISPECIES: TMEM175 family protein [unclassified Leeuwenhoekiella]MBA82527.1 hypothetical protein [Leeuwenhoekiella sp.]|tara:strand:- start:7996 stop:8613 length:618 start_codon:yes stop_codon:yes gene_type:complete
MSSITFPKARILAFNDAIFSIAITLLVLDIDIPDSNAINTYGIWNVLGNLIPNFIGFFVSFLVISLYWISNLKFSKYISDYDNNLLWLNIFLLVFVVLLPFSTAFYVNSFNVDVAFQVYCLNLIFLGLFNFLMIRRVAILNKDMPAIVVKWLKFRSLNVVLIWVVSFALAAVLPHLISRLLFVLIFVFQFFGDRYFKKRELLKKL